jgi:hypothetical protein
MKSLNIDTRELKSFRLLQKTKNLKSFLDHTKSFGLFMTCDSLHPNDRIKIRSEVSQNTQINYISKNSVKFLFKDKKWNSVKNLLKGGVVHIKHKDYSLFDDKKINYFLKNNKFSLRFGYSNFNLYRKKALEEYAKINIEEKDNKKVVNQIDNVTKINSILLPAFLYRSNHN